MKKWGFLLFFTALVLQGFGQADPYLMGRANMVRENFDSALFYLEEALNQQPGETEVLFQLGKCHFLLNNTLKAQQSFYEVEKRKTGMASLYLARTEARLNHREQAIKYLRIHLSSRYKVPENEILLDEDLTRLESFKGWQELWNEKNWYNQRDKDFQEALYLKNNGDALEAINLLNKLEKQGYKRSLVQAEKAALYDSLGNLKAARESLMASAKSDVRNLDALYQLAHYQMADDDSEKALISLNRILRQDPSKFEAYLLRAEAFSMEDNRNAAMEDVNTYLLYFPSDSEAFFRRGNIEFKHGKYLNAIQSYNKALALDQGNAAYYFARGRAYASTGTTRYAEKDLSMALDLDPLNGEIWYEKGKMSEKLGNLTGACFCYQKAFQYGVFEAGEMYDGKCN